MSGANPSADKTPADNAPGDKTPADNTPGDKTPADIRSGDKTPADKTPGDKTSADDRKPTARNPRRTALLITLAGAAITGLAAAQPWAAGTIVDPILGRQEITATGSAAAPAAMLLAVVAVAGVLAALLGGRVMRIVSGLAVVAAGLAVLLVAINIARDPAAALASLPGTATMGRVGIRPDDAAATLWPWLAAAGGALVASAGMLVVRGGPRWGTRATRFERASALGDAGQPRASGRANAVEDWERLSRDEDPTA